MLAQSRCKECAGVGACAIRDLDDDPNETLKGMNGLKWTTGRTDGVVEPRLETPSSVRNLDDDPNETLKGMNGLKWATGRADGVGTPLGNTNQCAES